MVCIRHFHRLKEDRRKQYKVPIFRGILFGKDTHESVRYFSSFQYGGDKDIMRRRGSDLGRTPGKMIAEKRPDWVSEPHKPQSVGKCKDPDGK